MQINKKQILFGHHNLWLTTARAIYWPDESILILSDLHQGKAAHFRKNGIAIPTTVNSSDLSRLDQLVREFNPQKIIFVGDLLHANSNSEFQQLKNFISTYPDLEFILIKGNHDRISTTKILDLGIHKIVETLIIQDVVFVHEPFTSPSHLTICGHKHPGITIKLPNKKKISLPCFVLSERQIILPAFSLFTGLDTSTYDEKLKFIAFDSDNFYEF